MQRTMGLLDRLLDVGFVLAWLFVAWGGEDPFDPFRPMSVPDDGARKRSGRAHVCCSLFLRTVWVPS